jgi:hypothetical protein
LSVPPTVPRTVRRPVRPALAASTAALLLLGGCGGGRSSSATPVVNPEDVETLLVQRQAARAPRLEVGEAACPSGVAARRGETFRCTLAVEGLDAPFEVTVAQVEGGTVTYEARPLLAIVDVGSVADFLRSRLEPEWQAAQVDCGPARARLLDVGAALECTAFDGAVTRYVQAVVEDRSGTVVLRER